MLLARHCEHRRNFASSRVELSIKRNSDNYSLHYISRYSDVLCCLKNLEKSALPIQKKIKRMKRRISSNFSRNYFLSEAYRFVSSVPLKDYEFASEQCVTFNTRRKRKKEKKEKAKNTRGGFTGVYVQRTHVCEERANKGLIHAIFCRSGEYSHASRITRKVA